MNARGFASDNYAGAHPDVLAAVLAANDGIHAPAYGDDPWTAAMDAALAEALHPDARGFLVFNGSAANVLCLSTLCRSWEAVICAATAHIHVDECGAPELAGRTKLLTVETPDGKLTPALVAPLIQRIGDEHAIQPRVVSITQSTELGTLYTLEEIAALAAFCHERGLFLHLDGARVFNGAAALGCSLREMLVDTGVDAVSFGATKIGGLGAEVAVFLRPEHAEHVRFLRKQQLQLASKHRFLAAQVTALLAGDLGLRNARHANAMAARLAERLTGAAGVHLTQTPQANAVFAILDPAVTARLQEEWRFYVWDEATGEVRWMTAWDTTEADVDAFAAAVIAAAG